MIVLFFIIRSFFKFSLQSVYLNQLDWFENFDFNKIEPEDYKDYMPKEKRPLHQFSVALGLRISGKLKGTEKLKLWKIFPYEWFMPNADWTSEKWGIFWCLVFAILSAALLIFICW